MSDEIDARKQALEEQRFEFERKKYEDDSQTRQIALRKARLDFQKVREDIRAAKRPFYGNPAYLTPLATICVALLGGFFAFGTNLLNSNIVALTEKRNELEQERGKLSAQSATLSGQVQTLAESKKGLERKTVDLLAQQAILGKRVTEAGVQINDLKGEKLTLADNLIIDRVRGDVDVLESLNLSMPPNPKRVAYLDLLKIIDKGGRDESVAVSALKKAYDSWSATPALKVYISAALYKGLKTEANKKKLKADVLDAMTAQVGQMTRPLDVFTYQATYLDWMADKTLFDVADRIEFVRKIDSSSWKEKYQGLADGVDQGRSKFSYMRQFEIALALWDNDVNVVFRKPWIDAYRDTRSDVPNVALAVLSQQAYVMRETGLFATTPEGHNHIEPSVVLIEACEHNGNVPICSDIATGHYTISATRKSEYIKWLIDNANLSETFLPRDNNYARLQSTESEVFRKIVAHISVTDAELAR